MTGNKTLFSGELSASLKGLQEQIRSNPAKPELRVYLFQLLCVMGDFKRAMTQLNVAADLSEDNKLMAQVCRPLLNCEALRQEIFTGKYTPLVFGEPEEWIGMMIQALKLESDDQFDATGTLREKAFSMADAIPGKINGEPFEWVADADSRLGPVLEIIVEGRYYLSAMSNIKELVIAEPCDLRDSVWLPATVVWKNSGRTVCFIPTRYEGSHEVDDDAILLSRKTEWIQLGKTEAYKGIGQRLLTTDQNDYPLMDIREITFEDNS